MIGRTLGHYRIVEKLGEGGMGIVYRAVDARLERPVAIKVLRPEAVPDPERKRRFVQEAKAASALNHPNIITIHDIDTADGVDFIVMEYVDGRPLDRLLAGGRLGLEQILEYTVQIASALAAAHEAGIVHRDIKPANLLITRQGNVKVLDFGLAKLTEGRPRTPETPSEGPTISEGDRWGAPEDRARTPAAEVRTQKGAILGTPAYMSPEQAEGKPVDPRSDVFSFGAVLYEMLAGRRAFQGESYLSILTAILRDTPTPLRTIRPDVPSELERIVAHALQKDPNSRYRSGGELLAGLTACQASLSTSASSRINLKVVLRRMQQPRVAVPVILFLLLAYLGVTWALRRSSRIQWAREQLPQIARLAEQEQFADAFRLAQQAEKHLPDDPQLAKLWPQFSVAVSIQTTPPGAEVSMKEYAPAEAGWEHVGQSPLAGVRVPRGNRETADVRYFRWTIRKPGFQTVETVSPVGSDPYAGPTFSLTLDPQNDVPSGMVRVPGGSTWLLLTTLDHLTVQLADYFIDKFEVTNKQFKQFVDSGGYRNRDYWKHPFVKAGRPLSWEAAITEFRDSTGRPGPAGWEIGSYPQGQGDLPVSGVSWYEAAAYAEFAGKSLPTIYHWARAAGMFSGPMWATPFAPWFPWVWPSHIVRLSNFSGAGLSPVGRYGGLSPFGSYDMAGNVKEWCWNETRKGSNRRYVLGGAFSEPVYMFNDPDAQDAFGRSSTYGFRCVKYISSQALSPALAEPVDPPNRDYGKEKPVPEETFRLFRSFYSYDKTPLEPSLDSVDDSSEHWRKEKVSFKAAYGNERIAAYLFLPKNIAPPYLTVVYFCHSGALRQRSSQTLQMDLIDFIVRSGRAVVYPVYKSTYERGDGLLSDRPNMTSNFRDHMIQWSKDLGRTIDYLETRKDMDVSKLGYYGVSWGAVMGATLPALEKRLKVAVLVVGGLFQQRTLPEAEQINFAPRVKIPVLMLNGRYDFVFPVEGSQLPMFRLLGTPEKDKRHVLFETGHSIPRNELIKETLDWFDRYLGPVAAKR